MSDTDKNPNDIYGNTIEVGDLVVSSTVTSYSNMVVGVVSHIGERQYGNHPVTIQYQVEGNEYAYELGAPKLEEKYRDWGRYQRDDGIWTYGYHGEEKTRMVNDRRVVGRKKYLAKQVRQKSCNILVIRKKDGTVPEQFTAAVDRHKLIFPEVVGE